MKNTRYCCLLSLLHMVVGLHASTYYEDQVLKNPDNYKALYNVGVEAFKQNNLQKAQAAFATALDCLGAQEKSHEKEQICYNAGNTAVKLENYADAVEYFKNVLSCNPEHELARKKMEYAQKMLEKKQEEENKKQDQSQQKDQKKDQQKDQKEQKNSEQDQQEKQEQQDGQKGQEEKDKQEGQEQSNKQSPGDEQKKEQPELTPQEKKLLEALREHDKAVHKQMGQQMIRGIAGTHAYNNW